MTETKLFTVSPFREFCAEPLPEPEWLIEGIFEKDSQIVLWGEPGCGKSFVALSWAAAVATGRPWLGKYPVKKETVLVCAGEGQRGVQRRGAALAREMGLTDIPGLYFYNTAPRLRNPKVLAEFMKLVKKVQPGLVIIDTLARSITGDENSAEAMSDWLHAAMMIQRETGAAVLVVHHTAKNIKKGGKPTERGSGALRGAMDTSILVRGGESISLTCVKQKDEVPFEDISLQLKPVVLRPADAERRALTSAVIVPWDETIPTTLMGPSSGPEAALAALTRPMTVAEWREATTWEGLMPPESTFYRWVKKLESEDLAEQDPETGKWSNLVSLTP